jgi:hypothetical protein
MSGDVLLAIQKYIEAVEMSGDWIASLYNAATQKRL